MTLSTGQRQPGLVTHAITNALTQGIHFEFDSQNNLSAAIEDDGTRTDYVYDSQNNLRQLSAGYIGVDMEKGEFPSFNQTRRGKWVDLIHNREDFPEEAFSSPASYVRHRMGPGSAREDWRMAGPESTYQHITRI